LTATVALETISAENRVAIIFDWKHRNGVTKKNLKQGYALRVLAVHYYSTFRLQRPGGPSNMHAPSTLGFDTANRVFSILISSAYRKNSLARMNLAEFGPKMLSTVGRCTKRGSPIQLTLLAFPFKVPNPAKVGQRTLPDSAELAAIRHLSTLRDSIQSVYPPGLEFHILHDGSLIADVFEIDLQEVRQYEVYFAKLVAKAQASDFIRCHDFGTLQRDSALDPCNSIEQFQSAADQWWHESRGTMEWRRSFQKTLGMINLREFPACTAAALMEHGALGSLPPGYESLQQRVHSAMVRYRIQDAIIHQFDPRPLCFPDGIHTTIQDRPGRLSLWLVRRGRSILPWHGIGCFDDCGQPQVVHAVDVCGRPNYQAEFIACEETPFAHWKSINGDGGIPLF
jgi:Pyoverdine/dityrosine biosynthesis protein